MSKNTDIDTTDPLLGSSASEIVIGPGGQTLADVGDAVQVTRRDLALALRAYAGATDSPQIAHVATLVLAGDPHAITVLDHVLDRLGTAGAALGARGGIEV